mgnify:CR=1 FL=1
MNYRIITYVIGWVLNLEAICMTLPAVTGLIYGEKTWTSFLYHRTDQCAGRNTPCSASTGKNRTFL